MFSGVGAKKVQPNAGKAGARDSSNVEVAESLTALERGRQFGTSKLSLQRLVFVNELVDCAHEIGYEATVGHLLPLVRQLASDPEVLVRQSLVGHFGDLAGFLIQSDPERGYQKVGDDLLPIVSRLLAEKASEVRQGAADALTTLASHLRPGQRGELVLMSVIALSHSNDDEDARSTAVQLLNGLAETLGADLCRSFVGVELVALCEDPAFRVRKATASNFAEVARVVGDTYLMARLLPAYSRLVYDPHWGVRKAAAEGLIGVIMALNVDSREEPLVPLVNALLKDSSRWVRMSALQQLGYFIAALEKSERVPASLFTQYVEIIEQTKANPDAADISYHCGYTFAAVTKTMGRSSWPTLQAPFLSLCRDPQMKTRKAMAASMHIVAETVGPDVAEQEVLPQFEALLLDIAHEVRHAALRNVSHMLRAAPRLAPQRRILRSLNGAMGNKVESWRGRHLVASQLGGICEALGCCSCDVGGGGASASDAPVRQEVEPASENGDSAVTSPSGHTGAAKLNPDCDKAFSDRATSSSPDEEESYRAAARDLVWTVVVPLFLQLCQDTVAEVRDEAARATARALRGAAPELLADPIPSEGSSGCAVRPLLPPAGRRLMQLLKNTFARGRSFRTRMCFVRMCDSIIREAPLHVFTDFLLKPLVRLSRDKVKNVRVLWATSMLPHMRKAGRLGHSQLLVGAAKRMAADDKDVEVRRLLTGVPLADIGTEAADAVLETESDLDDADSGEGWLGEGGTGNSSELDSNVGVGEKLDDLDVCTGTAVSSSAPPRAPASETAHVETPQQPITAQVGETSNSSSAAPVVSSAPPKAAASCSTGFHPPPRTDGLGGIAGGDHGTERAGTEAPASSAHAFFDPVEDSLVEQEEVEREIDAHFADRRLFAAEREALHQDDPHWQDGLPPRSPRGAATAAPAAAEATATEPITPSADDEASVDQTSPESAASSAMESTESSAIESTESSAGVEADLAEAPLQSEVAAATGTEPVPGATFSAADDRGENDLT